VETSLLLVGHNSSRCGTEKGRFRRRHDFEKGRHIKQPVFGGKEGAFSRRRHCLLKRQPPFEGGKNPEKRTRGKEKGRRLLRRRDPGDRGTEEDRLSSIALRGKGNQSEQGSRLCKGSGKHYWATGKKKRHQKEKTLRSTWKGGELKGNVHANGWGKNALGLYKRKRSTFGESHLNRISQERGGDTGKRKHDGLEEIGGLRAVGNWEKEGGFGNETSRRTDRPERGGEVSVGES